MYSLSHWEGGGGTSNVITVLVSYVIGTVKKRRGRGSENLNNLQASNVKNLKIKFRKTYDIPKLFFNHNEFQNHGQCLLAENWKNHSASQQ